jgi:SAM-dependent methyltransferase
MTEYRWTRCSLCQEEKGKTLITSRDPYLDRKDQFEVIECRRCGLARTRNLPQPEDLSTWYDQHYGRVHEEPAREEPTQEEPTPPSSPPEHSFLRRRVLGPLKRLLRLDYAQFAVSRVAPRGRILEVGCGVGNILFALKEQGADVEGIEPHSGLAEAARKRGLTVHDVHFENWNHTSAPFDQILFSYTLEQIEDPVNALRLAKKYLAPGGKVIILCPNLNAISRYLFRGNWFMWHLPYHKYFFTPQTMKKVLTEVGFRDIQLATDWRLDAEMESARIIWNRFRGNTVIPFPEKYSKLVMMGMAMVLSPFRWLGLGNRLHVVARTDSHPS